MRLNHRLVYRTRSAKIIRIYNEPTAPGFGKFEGAFIHEMAITTGKGAQDLRKRGPPIPPDNRADLDTIIWRHAPPGKAPPVAQNEQHFQSLIETGRLRTKNREPLPLELAQ